MMQLGELIDWLETLPDAMRLNGVTNPHSYRGYYEDLAVEPSGESSSPSEMAVFFQECVGKTFEGYKGGQFTMDRSSFVWLARYGCSGWELKEEMLVE